MIPPGALRVGEALVQTVWVGALWTVGYLVAPALFAHIDSTAEAGRIAGELFSIVAVLGLACGGLLLLGLRGRRGRGAGRLRAATILVMMLLVSASEWLVRPMMEAARLPDGAPGPDFGMLHGISAALYLGASLAGVFLVAAGGGRISRTEG
jgi:hypothetical protein